MGSSQFRRAARSHNESCALGIIKQQVQIEARENWPQGSFLEQKENSKILGMMEDIK